MRTTILLAASALSVSNSLSIPPSINDYPLGLSIAMLKPQEAGGPSQEAGPMALTKALADVQNAGIHPDSWVDVLERGSPWLTTLSAKPQALQASRLEGYEAALAADPKLVARRFSKGMGSQSFTRNSSPDSDSDGTIVNSIALLLGAVKFSFSGTFTVSGRQMSLFFDTLTVRFLWFLKLKLDVREGRGIRNVIERVARGGRKSRNADSKKFKKRPNVYSWCFADDTICIAQGTSGSCALWTSEAAFKAEQ